MGWPDGRRAPANTAVATVLLRRCEALPVAAGRAAGRHVALEVEGGLAGLRGLNEAVAGAVKRVALAQDGGRHRAAFRPR
jgi:hypothetical protein